MYYTRTLYIKLRGLPKLFTMTTIYNKFSDHYGGRVVRRDSLRIGVVEAGRSEVTSSFTWFSRIAVFSKASEMDFIFTNIMYLYLVMHAVQFIYVG
jgi:2,4-dienoyl-CoA reductase-like NADH-dependent reductase (Old Yellow Enzyme family)